MAAVGREVSEQHLLDIKIDTSEDHGPWDVAASLYEILKNLKGAIVKQGQASGIDVAPDMLRVATEEFSADTKRERQALEILKLRLKYEPL